jgi:uncharacterized protein with GYD domain
MPKYLIEATYTADGAKDLIKAGGSARQAAVEKMVDSLGGRVEAFFCTFGENDVITILDLPENLTAAALSLAVLSSGAVRTNTKVLLTPGEIDRAVKAQVEFKAPGP